MGKRTLLVLPAVVVALLLSGMPADGQKARPKKKAAAPTVVFAVLSDGKLIEPIGVIDKAALKAGENLSPKTTLPDLYRGGRPYSVIFGGKVDGTAAVVKSNIGSECGGSCADVVLKPAQPRLKGLVMALATNAKPAKAGSGVRRRPTADERAEIETLVRAEFKRQGTSDAALKNLRYHNLTALDVNGDGVVEFVGSYWTAPTKNERRILFFIAEKGDAGTYVFVHSDYEAIEPDDMMSGDLADADAGIGHELLLDTFDYDGDGVSEIFTIGKAFEGNNYYVYRRADGKWDRVLETYVYRCAY
jgi:hypothetical protein